MYVDGVPRATPAALLADLPSFLDGLAPVVGTGTVIAGADVAERLRLPTRELPTGDHAKGWPAIQDARRAGWDVRDVYRWSTFRRDRHEIHVGLRQWIEPGYCPFLDPRPDGRPATGVTVSAGLAEWQARTGVAYRGAPADAVNAVVIAHAACFKPGTRRRMEPVWRPRTMPHRDAMEHAYSRGDWQRPGYRADGDWLHGYDAVRSYLAAMSCLEVAAWALTHRTSDRFDPTYAGWWLVDLAPWTDPDLPDPVGYDPENPQQPDGSRRPALLTTPTLVLLAELGELGIYGGFRVLESWTAPAVRGIFKPAASKLEEAYRTGGLDVRAAVKAGYHAAHGGWNSAASDIRRPDWDAALTALARCNLWRKMWRAAAATNPDAGYWLPAFVDGIDTVYYPSRHRDPFAVEVPGFPLVVPDRPDTDRLGRFVPKYRLRIRHEESASATT